MRVLGDDVGALPCARSACHLVDNDLGYLYDIGEEQHAAGCYEIELVVEKIKAPAWDLS